MDYYDEHPDDRDDYYGGHRDDRMEELEEAIPAARQDDRSTGQLPWEDEGVVVDLALDVFEDQIAKSGTQIWLREMGRITGRRMMSEGSAALVGIPPRPAEPPDPEWLPRVYEPFLVPFLAGVGDEWKPVVRRKSIIAAVVAGVAGVSVGAGVTYLYFRWRSQR